MKIRRLWAGLFAVVLLVAGCGGNSKQAAPAAKDAPASQQQAAPTPATPQKTWSVKIAPGPTGAIAWMTEMVAEGMGAFKDQSVDLTVVNMPGGNEATKALMSGDADFALLAFDHVLKNRAQGADLVVVSFLTKNPGVIMIVQPELQGKVKSIKDLKGMKVGVSSLGGGTHMTLLSLMKQAGMEPSDIEVVAAKDKLEEMWNGKQIQAAVHGDPQISSLVTANKAWTLYDFRTTKDTVGLYGTEYPLGTLVTRQDVIQKDPEMVQHVVNAVAEANNFIKSHSPAEVADKIPQAYKTDPKIFSEMVAKNMDALALTGTVSQDSMNTVLKELKEKKVIPADSNVEVNTAINLSFMTKAPK